MVVSTLFIALSIAIALGVPIAISLIAATSLASFMGNMPLAIIPQKLITSNDSFPLMAIPLFIFSGAIMSSGGVSKRLVDLAESIIGWATGGLGIVANLAGIFFSAISGSSAATSAAVGTIMLPEMEKRGYEKEFSCAIIAASGTTGIIIPPSVTMVVYGVIAGVSISDLFAGGVIPGIFMGASLCLVTYFICKKKGYGGITFQGTSNIFKSFKSAIWGMLMPVIILGGIYGGIFTPTEAAAIAVLYGLVVAKFIYKELNLKDLLRIVEDTIISASTIMIIMNAAGLFSWLLTREQVPVKIAALFISLTQSPLIFLLLVNALLLMVGMLLNPSSAVTILAPILVPVAIKFNVDPVFFGILMVANLAIGSLTPPVGTGLFVASSISGVPLERVAKATLPFFLVLVFDILILTLFPGIIMF